MIFHATYAIHEEYVFHENNTLFMKKEFMTKYYFS